MSQLFKTYPKLETVFDRNKDTFNVMPEVLRNPEYGLINKWLITEKIDGTNIRVGLIDGKREIGGRSDNAQIPSTIIKFLDVNLPEAKLKEYFAGYGYAPETPVILFGEGYGPGIQKGGYYRTEAAFILFDVMVDGSWLNFSSVVEIAKNLGIDSVPVLDYYQFIDACLGFDDMKNKICLNRNYQNSRLAKNLTGNDHISEGIVARTEPLLLDRRGDRIMWKLKGKDFTHS